MVAKSMLTAHQPTLPLDVIPLYVQAKLARSATLKRYVLYLRFCVGSYSSSPSILLREL